MRNTIFRAATALILTGISGVGLAQSLVTLAPVRDTSIFEEGALSNALGPNFFVGVTAGNNTRRALLAFDLSSIPVGSTVTGVTLTLNLSRTPPMPSNRSVSVHPVTNTWAEGSSNAGSPGGAGAAATPGDATWDFNSFGSTMWSSAGGDFSPTPSATTTVLTLLGPYDWTGATLNSDVQGWINNPSSNNGWMIVGEEFGSQTALQFDTRENVNPTNRPMLTVNYTPAGGGGGGGGGPATSVPIFSPAGALLMGLFLAIFGASRLRKQ